MKIFLKSILSVSLSVLSHSGATENEAVNPGREIAKQFVRVNNEAFADEKEAPSTTFFGTKSVAVAFVLTNLH